MKWLLEALRAVLLTVLPLASASAQTSIRGDQIRCRVTAGATPMVLVKTPTSSNMTCAALDASLVLDTSTNPPTLRAVASNSNTGPLFVGDETPTGTVDGTNAVFTLAFPPISGSLHLYRNGLRMKPGVDYNVSNNVVTFAAASGPQPGDVLLADYRR